MSIPKQHHFVPKFYLRNFSVDSKSSSLQVYNKETDDYCLKNAERTTVIKHLYTLVDECGNKDVRIENFLGAMESDTKVIIDKIDARQWPTAEELHILAAFISFLHLRRPQNIERLRQVAYNWAEKALREMPAHASSIMAYEPMAHVKHKMTRTDIEHIFKNSRNYALIKMFSDGKAWANSLFLRPWLFMQPAQDIDGYIGCDNPVVVMRPGDEKTERDFLHNESHIFLPLSKKTCLHIGPGVIEQPKFKFAEQTSAEVELWNKRTAIQADIVIIGQTHEQLKSIVEKVKPQ